MADGQPLSVPAVDVVVLTWNDGALLERAVRSVLASTDVSAQIFVIDNGSSPPAAIDGPSLVLTRNETNRGIAPARNQGARLGSSPLICFLDSDAVLKPGSLGRLARAVVGEENVALSAPVFVDQAPEASAGRAPSLLRKVERVLGVRQDYSAVPRAADAKLWDVDFAIGACQMIRRSAFAEIGGLDESYFYGPEDVDFCLRLREAGWRVVQVADAPVEHPPRRRNRRLFTRRGVRHAWAVCRHLWRHRRFDKRSGGR